MAPNPLNLVGPVGPVKPGYSKGVSTKGLTTSPRKVRLTLIPGGRPEKGAAVTVNGRPATVVQSTFSTHVFRNDVSVKYKTGQMDLVPLEHLTIPTAKHTEKNY